MDFPLVEIKIKKISIVILFWNTKKWDKWEIKKGFYNKTYKLHPIEFTIYK
jgi:hypothetical protein